MDCNLHRRWATSPALDRNNLISAIIGNIRPSSPLALILPLPQSHPGTSSFPQRFFLPTHLPHQKVPGFGDLPGKKNRFRNSEICRLPSAACWLLLPVSMSYYYAVGIIVSASLTTLSCLLILLWTRIVLFRSGLLLDQDEHPLHRSPSPSSCRLTTFSLLSVFADASSLWTRNSHASTHTRTRRVEFLPTAVD